MGFNSLLEAVYLPRMHGLETSNPLEEPCLKSQALFASA